MLPNWLYGKSLRKLQEILNSGGQTAAGVSYSNTESGLEATNAQDAIDEAVAEVNTKAALTQITNPNLIDNPWFTVNQRGQSSYTTSWSYTLDRWKNLALSEVNVVTDGVQLVRGSSSDVNSGTLAQVMEESIAKLLDGRTITISALLSDGTVVTSTGTYVYKGGYDQLSKTSDGVTIDVASNSAGTENSFKVRCADADSNITVRAVKLELGSASTLAMDTVPNYATELLKCQRYFQRLKPKSNGYAYFAWAFATTTTKATAIFPICTEMRAKPTLTFNKIHVENVTTGAHSLVNSCDLTYDAQATLKARLTFDETTWDSGTILTVNSRGDTDAYLDLSADL